MPRLIVISFVLFLVDAAGAHACIAPMEGVWNSDSDSKLVFRASQNLNLPTDATTILIGKVIGMDTVITDSGARRIEAEIKSIETLKGKAETLQKVLRYPSDGMSCNVGPILETGKLYFLILQNVPTRIPSGVYKGGLIQEIYSNGTNVLAAEINSNSQWMRQFESLMSATFKKTQIWLNLFDN